MKNVCLVIEHFHFYGFFTEQAPLPGFQFQIWAHLIPFSIASFLLLLCFLLPFSLMRLHLTPPVLETQPHFHRSPQGENVYVQAFLSSCPWFKALQLPLLVPTLQLQTCWIEWYLQEFLGGLFSIACLQPQYLWTSLDLGPSVYLL